MKTVYLKDENSKNEKILAYQSSNVVGILEFTNSNRLVIDTIDFTSEEVLSYLFSKLVLINYLNKEIVINSKEFKNSEMFFRKHFSLRKDKDFYYLSFNKLIKQYVEIGKYQVGKLNKITDVAGVLVGHITKSDNDIQTGLTVVVPKTGNMFKEKFVAASYVYNGFGKSIGLVQIDELGTLEVPILLTNTLNVGLVADGLVDYMLSDNPEIGVSTGTINPVILECNDGSLNEIRTRSIKQTDVLNIFNNLATDFLEGNVGAGTGMSALGFKSGIGSASRVVKIKDKEYTIGVLVNANFQGSSSRRLIINGLELGLKLRKQETEDADKGSIVIVVATDAPLSSRQLKRIAKRAVLGIAKTGGYASNGSGDLVVSFSTANIIAHDSEIVELNLKVLNDNLIDPLFEATVDATEEAIINSLLYSKTVVGVRGNKKTTINEHIEEFSQVLKENILGE